jgi:hypothetical protein
MYLGTMFLLMMVMTAGAFMISAGSVVLLRTYAFLSNAVEARATVHSSEQYYTGKVFRYRTRDNNYIEVPAMRGTQQYNVGDEVPILYHARNPKTAYIKRRQNWWLMPSITAVAGVGFALTGLAGLIGRVPLQ